MKKSTGTTIAVSLMRLLSKLPLGFHYAFFGAIAWLMRKVFRYRRDVVMTNLARSFPDKKYHELKEIEKRFYQHFGEIIAEAVKFSGCTDYAKLKRQDFCESIISPEAEEAYRQGNGMMVLTSHCGNWEIIGGWFGYLKEGRLEYGEENICVVYKKLSSALWDGVFGVNRTAPLADKDFQGYVESQKVLRYALEHRNDKMVYVFPTDQFPYKGATRHEIPEFMHQKTYAMTGGAQLAHKLGMSVVYLRFESVRKGHYRLSFDTICNDASQMSPEEITERYYSLLQKDIEAQPWNYLWTHKRWK